MTNTQYQRYNIPRMSKCETLIIEPSSYSLWFWDFKRDILIGDRFVDIKKLIFISINRSPETRQSSYDGLIF